MFDIMLNTNYTYIRLPIIPPYSYTVYGRGIIYTSLYAAFMNRIYIYCSNTNNHDTHDYRGIYPRRNNNNKKQKNRQRLTSRVRII